MPFYMPGGTSVSSPLNRRDIFKESSPKPAPFSTPFSDWLGSGTGDELLRGGYADLYGRFTRMADEGIISPEEMSKMMGDYWAKLQPQLSAMRAKYGAEASRRLPGRSGAIQKSLANIIDVPAMQALGDFGADLYYKNLASQVQGTEGLAGLYNLLFSGAVNLHQSVKQREMAEIAAEAGGGGGIGDILGGLASFGGSIPWDKIFTAGAGAATGGTSFAFPMVPGF